MKNDNVLPLFSTKEPPVTKPTRKARTNPPDKCLLGEKELEWFKRQRIAGDPQDLWDEMIDWHLGNGQRKVDWVATWRNWCRNTRRFEARRQGVPKEQQDTYITDAYVEQHANPGETYDSARRRLQAQARRDR